MDIRNLLKETIDLKGSDLHLSAGLKPIVRVYGNLKQLDYNPLSQSDIEEILRNILDKSLYERIDKYGQVDFAFELPGVGRFRGNAFRQVRGKSVAFRAIPERIIPLENLGLPEQIKEQCHKRSGLILVTGPTGSGKSTTLASIIDNLNKTKSLHIITIEDPIEFVHTSKKCLIHQRQIGTHAQSFASALRSALREDPDVIMVGEMRDRETIELALVAAETGHLVLGTLHTRNAAKTIDRIISAFPANQQSQIRSMAAESLLAIVSQVLLPRVDQPGMIAAFEILIMTSGVQNLIREMKIYQIPSAIQTGARWGMKSMSQSLKKLVLEKKVDPVVAQEFIASLLSKDSPESGQSRTDYDVSRKRESAPKQSYHRGVFKFNRS